MKDAKGVWVAVALSSGMLINSAHATPITASAPFLFLNDKGSNDIGVGTGSLIAIGDGSVVPNGSAGTTGTASTTNLSTGATVTIGVPFQGLTTAPNQFGTNVLYNPNLLGPWTLTFRNGTDTQSVTTGSLVGASAVPFASNVTISGTSSNPTFSWTYPSGSVDVVTVGIYDKSRVATGGGVDQVFNSSGIPGTTGSFTVPTALAGGLTLQLNHDYTVDITGRKLRDPTGSASNANTLSVTQAFFDFTPLPTGSPLVNLPTVLPSGAYQYSMTVISGQTYFVDPTVAIGYSFAIGAGDPNFASVLLPAVQTNPFDVSFIYNGISFTDLINPNEIFDFPSGGVGAFMVTGIDPSLGLDPGNTTAFITGLTFVSDGTFTGTQTPITTSVPEPDSIILLMGALLGFGLLRRQCRLTRRGVPT